MQRDACADRTDGQTAQFVQQIERLLGTESQGKIAVASIPNVPVVTKLHDAKNTVQVRHVHSTRNQLAVRYHVVGGVEV